MAVRNGSGSAMMRAVAVLAMAAVAAGVLAGVSVGAGKALTKKKALKLFYTKGGADSRFINVGELATSYKTETTSISPFNVTNFTDVLSSDVTVPEGGMLLIWSNLSFEENNTSGPEPLQAQILVDGSLVGTVQESYVEDGGPFLSESIANTVATQVSAGTHTVKLQAYNPDDSVVIQERSITTLLVR